MNLEDIFQKRGLKKKWLAERLGVRPETVSRWLRNPEKIPEVKKPIIRELLGIAEDSALYSDGQTDNLAKASNE